MRLDNGTFGFDLICVRKNDKLKGVVVDCVLNMAKISDYSGVPGKDNEMKVVYESGQSSITITLMESIREFMSLVCMPVEIPKAATKPDGPKQVKLGSQEKPATEKDVKEKKEELSENKPEVKPVEENKKEVVEEKKSEVGSLADGVVEEIKEKVVDKPEPAAAEEAKPEEEKTEGKKEN